MEKRELDAAAAHVLSSYEATGVYSREFQGEHDTFPTMMAQIHHHRSVMQARLIRDDRFDLDAPYTEYGKVQFLDQETGHTLLLRSTATVAIEKTKRQVQLWFPGMPSPVVASTGVTMLVYKFDKTGLTLSIAATKRKDEGTRLVASGPVEEVGHWPFSGPDDGGTPFDQAGGDPFGDVGPLAFPGEVGEEGVGS